MPMLFKVEIGVIAPAGALQMFGISAAGTDPLQSDTQIGGKFPTKLGLMNPGLKNP